MSPISKKHSGASIMRDCARSKRLLIQMMCFGAMCVLGMRVGKKLETIYAEYSSKILA